MKRALLLCVASAIAGAGLAVGLSGRYAVETKTVAQELASPPRRRRAAGR